MTAIADGQVVEMNYTLTNDNGDVLDSSDGRAPLAYLQGKNNIIPGLEKEMNGKKVGDSFKVTIAPEEAYGPRNDSMIQAVPKEHFGPDAANIQPGMQFQVQDQSGQMLVVTAIEVKDDEIILDGNHPLAGKTLHFEVEVVSIRAASDEELTQGQPMNQEKQDEKDCCDDGQGECC